MEDKNENLKTWPLPEVVGALSGVNAGNDSLRPVDGQGQRENFDQETRRNYH